MGEQVTLTKQQIIAELLRSPHGTLAAYLPVGSQAAVLEPAFLSHSIAWNHRHGSIRDARLALPALTLLCPTFPEELVENSLAHLALLTPRQLAGYSVHHQPDRKGVWPFLKAQHLSKRRLRTFREMARDYLRAREACWPWWERTALAFRVPLRGLYNIARFKPCPEAQRILFENRYAPGTVFAGISLLPQMDAEAVAGFLREEQIPFLVAQGVLGTRIIEPPILAAVIDGMTPGQLVTNRKALEKWSASLVGATRGAITAAVERAQTMRGNVLKTTVAREAMDAEETTLIAELDTLQEAQLDAAPGIEGNWLIAGDKSGSMVKAIEVAALLAGYMARKVTGQVCLCFFDTEPIYYDVTGKSYADIQRMIQGIRGEGGTHIGASLLGAKERGFVADGIAIVSDGGDNSGYDFPRDYAVYTHWAGKEPPVYLYRVQGNDPDVLSVPCARAALPFQRFDIPQGIDHYALEGLAQTMRSNRYSLIQSIMDTPLLSLQQALQAPRRFHAYGTTS